MPSLFVRLTLCGILLSTTSITVQAAPARDAGNLTWPGKAQTQTPHYGVPPSPYGEVGDFFKKELRWPTKPAPAVPAETKPAPIVAPVAAMPAAEARSARPERYVSAPTEPYLYRPTTYSPMPQVAGRAAAAPMASLTTPPPLPAPQPRLTQDQMRALEAAPVPTPKPEPKPQLKLAPKPVTMAPIPNPAPPVAKPAPTQPAAVATAPAQSAPPPASESDAYQIPRTSKYYRGAQTDTTPQATPGTSAGVGFAPGQIITDPAAQSPRFYSLHREYGLSPDTISQTQELGQNDLPVAQVSSASPK